MAPRPTSQGRVRLKDLADRAGVSIATVSYVLNGSRSVGREVETRVREAAAELGYRPNRAAQTLATGRNRIIGLVVPDISNPYFPELAQAVERAATEEGYVLILVDTRGSREREDEAFAVLAEHTVQGALWSAGMSGLPDHMDLPVVVIGSQRSGLDSVSNDGLHGGRLLGEYAARMGHRRVGLLVGPGLTAFQQRRDGFVEAAGPDVEIIWEIECNVSTLHLPDTALEALRSNRVTLVAAATDVTALAAMRYLEDNGIRVPEDVSVLGYDDIPWAAIMDPPLTTVHQSIGEIGRQAVDCLLRRINEPDAPVQDVVTATHLVERSSVLRLDSPSS